MEHPQKGGISPGTLFKVAAEIAEFHLMECGMHCQRRRSDDKMCHLRSAAREAGLVLLSCGLYGNVIRILVPFTISDDDLEAGLDILEECLGV